ncbi:unnamed protein product [Coregonus sp. 'balchen']|nr:unnamed protein product [Coregonus sp. 'balchen']
MATPGLVSASCSDWFQMIKDYEKLDSEEERLCRSRQIYDGYIMKELLSCSHPFSKKAVDHVQTHLAKKQVPPSLFQPYIVEICDSLRGMIFQRFIESDKFTRFCQWKNVELNIHLTMNDFSVHRIIGRGGFGEVYGCRKADTGKMYAMKCLDKKRIKMKQGETLALNERIMLSLVSTGDCPFIVCMTYAFHTPDKLCFILDLMNGKVLDHLPAGFWKPANILLDEHGHVRISDLGLACDFSKKKPHASVGTHGYMAPEVLQKGTAYDSSADWFSLGCMLFKLLRGLDYKNEARKRAKNKQLGHEEDYALGKDCIMHGYMLKLGNPFLTQWQRRYFYLFPNRVEWRGEGESRQNLLTMEQIVTVEETQIKDKKCILLRIKGGKQFVLQCEKLLRRAPKVIGKGRAGVVEFSKPPLTHRNSNGLGERRRKGETKRRREKQKDDGRRTEAETCWDIPREWQ